jgi:hypothetical protein
MNSALLNSTRRWLLSSQNRENGFIFKKILSKSIKLLSIIIGYTKIHNGAGQQYLQTHASVFLALVVHQR